jgi:hypothetical protein
VLRVGPDDARQGRSLEDRRLLGGDYIPIA